MANITKTFLYPVPTVWMGQDQDDLQVGVATYNGPKDLKVFMELDDNGDKTDIIHDTMDPNGQDYPPVVPANMYIVDLDASKYPNVAAAMFGGISGPNWIEVAVGPSSDPNPLIQDPSHFHEVYDLTSFGWDPALNSGAGGWRTPKFSYVNTEEADKGSYDYSFGWDWVRYNRNRMLIGSDGRIPEDAPESMKTRWKEYRQKLRDLPTAWAGVGTATHLIVWPRDPDMQDADEELKNDTQYFAEGGVMPR
tara:strand:- start:3969 stop:4718 length:750 start_codon:yes stop_codon:yes gene_type:complete